LIKFHQEQNYFQSHQLSFLEKMSAAPPPYPYDPSTNTQGPQQYPGGQPYMGQPYGGGQSYMGPSYGGGQPYMGQPYGGGQPIIIMQQQQQQQQQQQWQQQQQVIVRRSGTNHGLCCLICFLTGGITLPCWILACICE